MHSGDKSPSIYSVHVYIALFQNAYTATAINSTNFCASARDAFLILVENALRVTAINTVGDFVLFLGKVPHRHIFWSLLCGILHLTKWTKMLFFFNSYVYTLRCL